MYDTFRKFKELKIPFFIKNSIIEVFLYDYKDKRSFIYMEALPGLNISKVDFSKLSKRQKIEIEIQLAGIVASLHESDIIHNDLKIENIMS